MYQNCYSGPLQTAIPLTPYSGQNQFPTAFNMPKAQAPSNRCKYINSLEDVTPSDVPMDGSSSFFPLIDGSTIYVKHWNSDGTIETIKYIKEETPEVTPKKVAIEELLNERFDELAELIRKNKPSTSKRGEANTNA